LGIGSACFMFGVAIYSLRLYHQAKQTDASAKPQGMTDSAIENEAPTRFRLQLLRSKPDGGGARS
jgi:hypothetical protein